jgi:flavin-binding protein dodecin
MRRAPDNGHRAAAALITQPACGAIAYTFFTNPEKKEETMKDHVYKQIELTGSSEKSSDDAVRTAIAKASKTLRNLHWFEVTETRGQIEDDKVVHWQVTIKVGLRIE